MAKKKRNGGGTYRTDYTWEIEIDELGAPKKIRVTDAMPGEEAAIDATITTALDKLAEHRAPPRQVSNPNASPSLTQAQQSAPLFSKVVQKFLETYPKERQAGMYRKHKAVLPMFRDVIGDKPVSEIKQTDINDFFELLERLPPRWSDECRKRRLTIRQLAAIDHAKCIGPKTFRNTYLACIRPFLKESRRLWQDQGFPTTLTTEGIAYKGNREEGENKQRAFAPAELKRLFEGSEMRRFAADPEQIHRYWLPHIGLFTGARVNELCQVNPQTDIVQDPDSKIWYFWITEETDGDDRIAKRTKNSTSRRKVPVHSTLLKCGFLDYVSSVKKSGAKLLFPAWPPHSGKASAKAEKWFRKLLSDIGLRDVTSGKRLVGMHAFRSTLLNRAMNLGIDATPITGHAGNTDRVVRGYQGELSLENKQKLLEGITFELEFIKPNDGSPA